MKIGKQEEGAHVCTRVAVFIPLYIMHNVMLIIIGNVYFKNSIRNQYGCSYFCHISTESVSNIMHVSMSKQLIRCLNYFGCARERVEGSFPISNVPAEAHHCVAGSVLLASHGL